MLNEHPQKERQLERLLEAVNREGLQAIAHVPYLKIIEPFIWKEWLGNGGKRGYQGLADRYGLSYRQVEHLIQKLKQQHTNEQHPNSNTNAA